MASVWVTHCGQPPGKAWARLLANENAKLWPLQQTAQVDDETQVMVYTR